MTMCCGYSAILVIVGYMPCEGRSSIEELENDGTTFAKNALALKTVSKYLLIR